MAGLPLMVVNITKVSEEKTVTMVNFTCRPVYVTGVTGDSVQLELERPIHAIYI